MHPALLAAALALGLTPSAMAVRPKIFDPLTDEKLITAKTIPGIVRGVQKYDGEQCATRFGRNAESAACPPAPKGVNVKGFNECVLIRQYKGERARAFCWLKAESGVFKVATAQGAKQFLAHDKEAEKALKAASQRILLDDLAELTASLDDDDPATVAIKKQDMASSALSRASLTRAQCVAMLASARVALNRGSIDDSTYNNFRKRYDKRMSALKRENEEEPGDGPAEKKAKTAGGHDQDDELNLDSADYDPARDPDWHAKGLDLINQMP